MTHNQIDFQTHKETVRHNLATESETARNNQMFLAESNRHNIATETNASRANSINALHYANQDQVAIGNLAETQEHNRASEAIGFIQARASVSQASAAVANAETNAVNAKTNILNAMTAKQNTAITRSNVAYQYELGKERNKTDRFNAETQLSSVQSQNTLRKAQTLKTYVNTGTDLLDSLSGAASRTINSLTNVLNFGATAAKAIIGGL